MFANLIYWQILYIINYRFGGIGGQGGNVQLIAKESYSLEKVLASNKTKRIIAKHGRDSSHNFILGIPGESVTVEVPIGITVFTDDGKKLGKFSQLLSR